MPSLAVEVSKALTTLLSSPRARWPPLPDLPSPWGRPLLTLLGVDALLVALHLTRWSGANSADWLLLQADHGLPEWWQYAQTLAVAVMLALLWTRRQQLLYAAWSGVYLYALLDDALLIHELGGVALADGLGLRAAWGLRPADFGELMVCVVAGAGLLGTCMFAQRRSLPAARRHGLVLWALFLLLVLFGVGVDMAHVALDTLGLHVPGLNVLEDGGELVAMSITAAWVHRLLQQ